jgi:hypothetical protein
MISITWLRARRIAFLFVATCFWTLNVARAQPADSVFESLLYCKVGVFDILRANKAALGPATVTPHLDPNANSADPRATRVKGAVVRFKAPITAYGLTITEYTQVVLTNDGKPGTYWWGFHVNAAPDAIAAAIKARLPTADLRQRGAAWGLVHEVDPVWRKDGGGSAIETQVPLRMLLIEPSRSAGKPGSTIRCGVVAKLMETLFALPDANDLFDTAQ